MATYRQLTLYYNNSYSRIDIPTREALNANSSKETRQIADLNDNVSIKRAFNVEVSGDIAKQANFISVVNQSGTYYYDVLSASPLNSTTYNFSCELNPFLSDPTYVVQGKLARITPASNNTQNVADEPFVPTDRAKQTILGTGLAFGSAYESLVMSTVDLDSSTYKQTTMKYTYGEGDKISKVEQYNEGSVSTPDTSYFEVNVFGNSNATRIPTPGVGIYKYDKGMMGLLANWGITDAIVARWNVPTTNVTLTQPIATRNYITTVKGDCKDFDIKLSDQYNNRKTTLYNATITVRANASGESKTFAATDVFGNNYDDSSASGNRRGYFLSKYSIWLDPSPTGKPYCTLALNRYERQGTQVGDNRNSWARMYTKGEGTVGGARWYQPSTTFEGVRPGLELANYSTAVQLANARLGAIAGVGNAASSVGSAALNATEPAAAPDTSTQVGGYQGGNLLSGLAKPISDVVQAGINGMRSGDWRTGEEIMQENAINDIKNRQTISNTFYCPAYQSASLDGVASYGDNDFTIYMSNMSDNDKQNFDRFLTEYGWASSEIVGWTLGGNSYITNGKNFTYVQFEDCHVVNSGVAPIGASELLRIRLLNGVRIWKNGSPKTVSYSSSNFN